MVNIKAFSGQNYKSTSNAPFPTHALFLFPAADEIVGQPVRAVGEAMKAGKLDPNLLVISYTVRPTGEVVTLNNRGLAALRFKHFLLVGYDSYVEVLAKEEVGYELGNP
jgi:hypothetical protein